MFKLKNKKIVQIKRMPSCLYLADPYTDSSKEVEIDLSSTLGQFKDVVAQHTGISPQEQGKWRVIMKNALESRYKKVLQRYSVIIKLQVWKVINKIIELTCWFCRKSRVRALERLQLTLLSELYLGPCKTSMMELFIKNSYCFFPLTMWTFQKWPDVRRWVGGSQLPDGRRYFRKHMVKNWVKNFLKKFL